MAANQTLAPLPEETLFFETQEGFQAGYLNHPPDELFDVQQDAQAGVIFK